MSSRTVHFTSVAHSSDRTILTVILSGKASSFSWNALRISGSGAMGHVPRMALRRLSPIASYQDICSGVGGRTGAGIMSPSFI